MPARPSYRACQPDHQGAAVLASGKAGLSSRCCETALVSGGPAAVAAALACGLGGPVRHWGYPRLVIVFRRAAWLDAASKAVEGIYQLYLAVTVWWHAV